MSMLTLSRMDANDDPTKPIRYDFISAINRAFLITFRPDGVEFYDDPITINGVPVKDVIEGKEYLKSYITTLSGFLGLPNRKLKAEEGQSWKNIGLNFVGWQEDASWPWLIFNFIFTTAFNIIVTPIKFLFHIIRLGTEVIPAILSNILCVIGDGIIGDGQINLKILHRDKERSIVAKILPGIGNVLLIGFGVLVSGLGYVAAIGHTIGCYLTDPITAIRDSYKVGYNWLGVWGGFIFATVSVVGILAIYTIAFPLLTQIALPAIPVVMTHLPRPVIEFIMNVAMHVLPTVYNIGVALTPVAAFIAKGLDIVTFGLFNIASIVTSMPIMIGIGALAAPVLALIGSPIDKLVRKIKDKWFGVKPQPNIIIVQDGEIVKNPKTYQELMKRFAEDNRSNRLAGKNELEHRPHNIIDYNARKIPIPKNKHTDEKPCTNGRTFSASK